MTGKKADFLNLLASGVGVIFTYSYMKIMENLSEGGRVLVFLAHARSPDSFATQNDPLSAPDQGSGKVGRSMDVEFPRRWNGDRTDKQSVGRSPTRWPDNINKSLGAAGNKRPRIVEFGAP
ncbi:jg8759 [Pararge aegeria aegeria]|uniref:Jg8759 protein n=1 Tax=Pararge aegeria aegeria TaxID=348720 RepID=A0A8S4S297_9NEOP|nr:jg8759 [Pararge aegeria aegeria]